MVVDVHTHRAQMQDEQTPLLKAGGAPQQSANEDACDEDDMPLPKAQILFLSFARLIDPISYFAIFPFINQMIYETGGISQADVGFYSGLIESLFSLVQMFCMMPWAWLADRYGRKPVLVASMIGLSVATAGFGFSQAVWQMVLFRCVAGLFSGSVTTIRTMVSENSTQKTQAQAFSYYSVAYTFGVLLGPIIGGLANPVTEMPSLFGNIEFFDDFPYALPTVVGGIFGLLSTSTTIFFVKETLTTELLAKMRKSAAPNMTNWELLKVPGVKPVLYVYSHFMLNTFIFTALFPLAAFTDIPLGGFSFPPKFISVFLAAAAIFNVLWILGVCPPLQRRIGATGILKLCAISWVFTFSGIPICNLFLREDHVTLFWVTICILNIQTAASAMGFVATQLALNHVSPSPASLGTLNAMALSIIYGIRTFAPGVFTSLFATSARKQLLKGHLVWLVAIFTAVILVAGVRWLPRKIDDKASKDSDEEDSDAST